MQMTRCRHVSVLLIILINRKLTPTYKIVTITQMFIFKWRIRCRCCRCCLSSLFFLILGKSVLQSSQVSRIERESHSFHFALMATQAFLTHWHCSGKCWWIPNSFLHWHWTSANFQSVRVRSIFLFPVLAQADHNNMDAPSNKAYKKDGGLEGAFPANLKGFPREHACIRIFWPFPHKKQRTLQPLA